MRNKKQHSNIKEAFAGVREERPLSVLIIGGKEALRQLTKSWIRWQLWGSLSISSELYVGAERTLRHNLPHIQTFECLAVTTNPFKKKLPT